MKIAENTMDNEKDRETNTATEEPNRKEAKYIERKRQMLDALKRCLARDVYSRITVQDVSDESEYSKGGLLYYYPTKEGMYLELMEDIFNEIEKDHANVLKSSLASDEKASISAHYGIEKFVLDTKMSRILLNLIMYSLEDNTIKDPLQVFIRKHLNMYKDIIEEARKNMPNRRKSDFDYEFIGRLAQTIVFAAGILEIIDPIDIDATKLIGYMMSLFKG